MSLCRRVKLELRIRTIKKILVGEFHWGKQKRENTKKVRGIGWEGDASRTQTKIPRQYLLDMYWFSYAFTINLLN